MSGMLSRDVRGCSVVSLPAVKIAGSIIVTKFENLEKWLTHQWRYLIVIVCISST
jgi:hypothetical protein